MTDRSPRKGAGEGFGVPQEIDVLVSEVGPRDGL